jgi:hypothetical protein
MTQILSAFKILKRVGFAVLFLGGTDPAKCCGPDWTALGMPPWSVNSIVQSREDPCAFICGTSRNFHYPNSGGVYRRDAVEANWEYTGLADFSVLELRRFAFNPQSLFAATSEGLYKSDDDGYAWDLLTEIGSGGDRSHVSFAISPYDSTEWLLGSMELGLGRLYISRNSGQVWNVAAPQLCPLDLTFSSLHEHVVYMADCSALSMYDIDTDSLEYLYLFWAQDVLALAQDTIRHCIYFATQDSLGRYDEVTGEVLLMAIPGIGSCNGVLFWPPESLIVGTQDSLFAVDLEFEYWRNISDSLSAPFNPWLCAESIQVVSSSANLYCRDLSATGVHEQPVIDSPHFVAYPNPTNAFITVLSDASGDVEMYNVLGQAVYRFVVVKDVKQTLSFDGHASGTYYFIQSLSGSRNRNQTVVPIVIIK